MCLSACVLIYFNVPLKIYFNIQIKECVTLTESLYFINFLYRQILPITQATKWGWLICTSLQEGQCDHTKGEFLVSSAYFGLQMPIII